jgi:peptidoglycan/xylan/chitin deacetylase (PgdA/CDA1 family)
VREAGLRRVLWGSLLAGVARRRSVILGYHGVAERPATEDPYFLSVPPSMFRAQLELMLSTGFTFLTVAELAGRAGGEGPRPGLAALSFDDGMQDNYAVVLPILREYNLPATVFVVTGPIGRRNPWLAPESGARMMTDAELRELAEAGIELGAHTVTHPDLSTLDHDMCLREMRESRAYLEHLTGQPVRSFAYPYARYGPPALAAVRDAGFAVAVTGDRGSSSPLELRRSLISGKDGMPTFVLKAAGVHQRLFDSAPGRAFRVVTRRPRRRIRAMRDRNR